MRGRAPWDWTLRGWTLEGGTMWWFLLVAACGTADPAEERPDFAWQAGDFQFTTVGVDDKCLDGALEALFLPKGPGTTHDFEYLIHVPAYEDLPTSYDIDLRAPFIGMPVTVTEGDGGTLVLRGSVMDEVALGAAAYGDCVVTMTADADLLPTDPDSVQGEARITLEDPRGSDQRCPEFEASPCGVTLVLAARRG